MGDTSSGNKVGSLGLPVGIMSNEKRHRHGKLYDEVGSKEVGTSGRV